MQFISHLGGVQPAQHPLSLELVVLLGQYTPPTLGAGAAGGGEPPPEPWGLLLLLS